MYNTSRFYSTRRIMPRFRCLNLIRLAISHLDKHQTAQLPKEGQPDVGLTKDYCNSPLHRFKKPGSRIYQNIYPPSATLHLSNIPPTVEKEQIKDAFSLAGCEVRAFEFFPKDRKMAVIQLGSAEEAISALVKMQNFQLFDSSHLRVSFSKSTISTTHVEINRPGIRMPVGAPYSRSICIPGYRKNMDPKEDDPTCQLYSWN